jgi:hypothetical protein
MDRDAYRRSIFLDRRISAARAPAVAVPARDLIAHAAAHAAPPPRAGWIFHIAHCGSTLLARALDRPDDSLVLREPLALRQLGVARAGDGADEDWRARLHLVAALAGRRYRPDAPAIVKANVPVNFIAADIMALDPSAPAIFLYFRLRAYLLAVLRTADHRAWVQNITTQLAPAIAAAIGPVGEVDIAERAAALWAAQMRLYADAIRSFAQARSLDAEHLFAAPRPALAAAAAHFGVGIGDADLDDIVGGEIFATYSKGPDQAFDNMARLALQAETARRLDPEIARARHWLEARLARNPLPERLGKPLAGSDARLLLD